MLSHPVFSIDRLSGAELVRRGLVTPVPATWQPPAPVRQPEPKTIFQPQASQAPGIIYVLQALPLLPVKIGFTRATKLQFRVMSIQTGCPYPLKVVAKAKGRPAQEREAHALLAAHRLTGEWFDWSADVQAFAASLRSGIKAALALPLPDRSPT